MQISPFPYNLLNGDVGLRINTTIYCINFYFLKQYIVYKSFSATAQIFLLYLNKFIPLERNILGFGKAIPIAKPSIIVYSLLL